MKITKTSSDVDFANWKRDIANIGCNVCPCCGERRTIWDWAKVGGSMYGISSTQSTSYVGFLFPKVVYTDCYSCATCGAEWESDPY